MSAPDNNGWLPIESAPRDGTNILVWSPHGEAHGKPSIVAVDWHTYNGESDWRIGVGEFGPLALHAPPTHWQPLPEPPEAA